MNNPDDLESILSEKIRTLRYSIRKTIQKSAAYSALSVGVIGTLCICSIAGVFAAQAIAKKILVTPTAIPFLQNNVTSPVSQNNEPSQTAAVDANFYTLVSLKNYSELSSQETNLGLPPGVHTMIGIPFENGWKATTKCNSTINLPIEYSLDVNVSSPLEVYFLIQAGWGLTDYANKEIGYLGLEFNGQESYSEPLVMGYNIRDWSRNKANAINTLTAPNVQEAWQGTLSDGVIGGMDILILKVPYQYQDSVLTKIVVADTSETTINNVDPCIHLLGITVLSKGESPDILIEPQKKNNTPNTGIPISGQNATSVPTVVYLVTSVPLDTPTTTPYDTNSTNIEITELTKTFVNFRLTDARNYDISQIKIILGGTRLDCIIPELNPYILTCKFPSWVEGYNILNIYYYGNLIRDYRITIPAGEVNEKDNSDSGNP
jgi:hypothetical protein